MLRYRYRDEDIAIHLSPLCVLCGFYLRRLIPKEYPLR